MNELMNKENNNWIERSFVYCLNDDGERYTLRYFKNELTAEKRCYCKDVYESFGQPNQSFDRKFHSPKMGNEVYAEGTNNRSMMCSFKDALTYVLDQYDDLQHAFNERGVKAIECGADNDIIGMVSEFANVSREQASTAIAMSTPQAFIHLCSIAESEQDLTAITSIQDALNAAINKAVKEGRGRLQAEQQCKQLSAEINEMKQRDIKEAFYNDLKNSVYKFNWNTLQSILKNGFGKVKPFWDSVNGTVNHYDKSFATFFTTYRNERGYYSLAYREGYREQAYQALYQLFYDYLDYSNRNKRMLF